ncbi:MAG TPA: hypothetical protein VHE35_30330 [Kofleriaceae bacterium]|nr:hypothetical protein [Kofleriaceae bacterium]
MVAIAPAHDAGTMLAVVPLDAGRPRASAPLDAGRAPAIDAASLVSVDAAPAVDAAAPPAPPPIDAAPAPVAVTFRFDTWCDLTVDGVGRGRVNKGASATVSLAPGPHDAVCGQGAAGSSTSWKQTIHVAAGRAQTFEGELLPRIEVVAGVGDSVRIDGVGVARGASLTVKYGTHTVEVVSGGKVVRTERVEVTAAGRCTLRDRPALACYP